ncbi:MAG: ComF family protein [Clostridiales bacterium]|jgi:ComF family protein|nr:ComF family protein [Eubacteriales bacterium]MDH7566176.1 ComF family protein [Clostridiales bacterium]
MLGRILNVIFPPRCIFCGAFLPVWARVGICDACYGKIPFMQNGDGGSDVDFSGRYCDEIVCVCDYAGIIRDALIRYKFFGRPAYGRTFAALLSDRVKGLMERHKFDMIISVPLYRRKEWKRGFNQSYLISKVLSRETGVAECSRLLSRVKDTESQSLLNRSRRRTNIMNAFMVHHPDKISNKTILLIDDIFTTGSTLEECARVLKEAGAKSVMAAVLASGRKSWPVKS